MNHELIRKSSYDQLMHLIHDHLNRVNSPLKRINAEAHNSIVELVNNKQSKTQAKRARVHILDEVVLALPFGPSRDPLGF